MALISPKCAKTAQQLMEQIEQRSVQLDHDEILSELRNRVKQYEARYGVSSDCVHDAIEAGELVEDIHVCDWIFEYQLLRRVEGA